MWTMDEGYRPICEDLSRLERDFITDLAREVRGFGINEACEALSGFEISQHAVQSWHSTEVDAMVVGLTNCEAKAIHLALSPTGLLKDGSLLHEMVHVIQKCKKGPVLPGVSDAKRGHWQWKELGIYDLLWKYQEEHFSDVIL